jgi:hypothetical protein
MNQHQGKYGKIKFHFIFLFFIIIFSSFISVASAGAPPLDNRPGYLLPHLFPPYINQSAGDCFTETDSFKAFNHPFRPPPFFLNMSENYAFMNISCEKTGERYVSEVWYFTDWDEFSTQRESLFEYLTRHGTVSNVTLDLSPELARTNNSYISGFSTRQIDAIRYENSLTAGYFVIISINMFPEPSYYITYYGIVGPANLQEHTPQLKTLIMSTFPGLMEYQTCVFNPESPMMEQSLPLPTGLFFIAVMVVMFIRSLRGRL